MLIIIDVINCSDSKILTFLNPNPEFAQPQNLEPGFGIEIIFEIGLSIFYELPELMQIKMTVNSY